MNATPGYVEYQCKRCQDTIQGQHVMDIRGYYEKVSEEGGIRTLAITEWDRIPVDILHQCDDGGVGLAVLIGAMPENPV